MAAPPWLPNGVGGWLPTSGSVHSRLLGVVKTALLRQLVSRDSLVCDLFCGRGTDTGRWAEAKIGRYIGVDLTGSALEEAREQWENHQKPFPAEFCMLNPCMVDLESHLLNKGIPAEVVSCFAHLQDCFTSEESVKCLLKNVVAILKPGGFFFGTVPDSSTIWYKYQKAVQEGIKMGSVRANGPLSSVRTELYKLTFDDDRFQHFGSKYHLRYTDDGLPAQSQLLVHFPTLIKLAKEVGLECLEIQNLTDFYEDHSGTFSDALRSSSESGVESKGVHLLDQKHRLTSQALDVLNLYTTFVFKKCEAIAEPYAHPSLAPMSKTSRSIGKYSVEFFQQPSPLRAPRNVKKEDSSSPGPSRRFPANNSKAERREDSYRYDMEVDHVDAGVELRQSRMLTKMGPYQEDGFDTMQDTGSGDLNRNGNVGDLEDNNASKIQQFETRGEDRTNSPYDWMPGRSAVQGDAMDSVEQSTGALTNNSLVADPRSVLPKHESGAMSWRGGESSKVQQSNRGPRLARGFNAAAMSHALKSEPVVVDESGHAEMPQATADTAKTFDYSKERLDQSSAGELRELQGRATGNESPKSSRRLSKDNNRDDVKYHDPVPDPGTIHYFRRGHDVNTLDETNLSERPQGMSPADDDSKHYRRRSRDNKEGRKKRDPQQEHQQQSPQGDLTRNSRHQQRRAHDSQHPMKSSDSMEAQTAPVVIVNRTSLHYERRIHEDVNDRSRVPNQAPQAMDRSSKQYAQRAKDDSEAARSDESRENRSTIQNRRQNWAGSRSGSHVESRRLS